MEQRPVFNNMVYPQGRTFSSKGIFTASFNPRGKHTLPFRRMEGQIENFTPGNFFTPRGQNSPLGYNFAPGGQSLPLGVKLRMCHRGF
jgi:hypothetical protein